MVSVLKFKIANSHLRLTDLLPTMSQVFLLLGDENIPRVHGLLGVIHRFCQAADQWG